MVLPTAFLIHTATIQKRHRMQKITYTGSSGTPVVAQTVTGTTSHVTAVISALGTGYLVVKTLSGTFTAGEAITIGITFAATLGTQTDYVNQSGEYQYYWSDDQTSVACRFGYSGGGKGEIIHETGQLLDQPLKCLLPSTTTIDLIDYRIVTLNTGFVGTYDLSTLYPISNVTALNHYTAVLRKVTV
jgi:hypothetical protein